MVNNEKKKKLSVEKKTQILKWMNILEERKKNYWILSSKLQEHQAQVIPAIEETIDEGIPKNKYILFQWGNGSWKTHLWMYVTVLLALGDLCYQYNLPYIWSKKNIWIVTKSGSNVSSTVQPYLIWEGSKTKIPPESIKKIVKDNDLLKKIILVNWTTIEIRTYDQWRERVQGWNPDWILIDEEPTSKWVWEELMNRVREPYAQLMLTMTPLSWLTPVYSFFYEAKVDKWSIDRRIKFLVASTENKHADHSWLMFLSEQDRKMRMYWMFVPPTWLVYSSFNRHEHVVPHFHPEELWMWVKYYAGLDFWITHPTWFILVAVDLDWNHYVFDWFLESNLLIKDMADKIKALPRKYWIELEYIVWDTAAKRERTELAQVWVKTVPADKWSKWENKESNRNASILKVNWLFNEWKLYISDKLMNSLVKELEQHHYKETWRNGEVVKTDDDIIDALRYCIWSIKKPKVVTSAEQKFISKHWYSYKTKNNNKYNQPY